MAYFRLEVLDVKGKIIELQYAEIPSAHTVGQALQSSRVNKLKKEACHRGYGFRVKREEEV